tara:strand:+ start:532 stop:1026 length:495 start_codon:yes stop_codon:yes gene_type:complete
VAKKLSEIEIFDGMTVDKVFSEIFNRSTEERERAIKVFDEITTQLEGKEDVFMIGDKANPYLEIAQKSTDNLTKMLATVQRFFDVGDDPESSNDKEELLKILSENESIPEEMKERDKEWEEEDENDASLTGYDFSILGIDKEDKKPEALKFKIEMPDENLERFK